MKILIQVSDVAFIFSNHAQIQIGGEGMGGEGNHWKIQTS